MATPNKVIEHVDNVKINAYRAEEKFQWLCELDGLVKRLVMQEKESVRYSYPEDMDTELLIEHPFDSIYALYLEAQIDLHNKEYEEYNNAVMVFNSKLEEYKKAYIREHMPRSSGGFKNVVG